MDVLLLDDTDLFAAAADEFLRHERFSANVIATNLHAIRRGVRPVPPGATWIVVEDAGVVRGAAMHTPPFPLFLPRLDADVAETLAHALSDARRPLPGVNGDQASVARFADVWLDRTGQPSRCRTSMRMYVLGVLRPPLGVPGRARVACESDGALLAHWAAAFHDEAMRTGPAEDWGAWAHRRIAEGDLWVWIDGGEPVSMAARSAPAAGVSRVGPVFTSPDARRRGYGAAVTAAVTRAAIDAGAEEVVLYTDLANPVSNSIYQTIGYRPDHDAEERDFFA
ncbi:MAG: GNAT family N-acetyltransferase [Acidimicrobiales bacterium]